MEQLGNLIYDAISKLRSNKKQPNENTIYSLISSNSKSLSKEQLEEPLNCFVNEEKLENKPHNALNSYYIETDRANLFSSIETRIQCGPPTNPTLTETTKSTLHSDETPPPPTLLPTRIDYFFNYITAPTSKMY